MNLKSQTPLLKLKEIILLTLLGVLMYISQVIMSQLPNIEIVSLLIIIITRKFGYKALASIYVFVGCEILTYGLSMWVINYLYVWLVLWFSILLIRKIDSPLIYSLISAIFGLLFGTLCSVPYFLTGGITLGVTYIVGGFWFDILHCIGNFVSTLFLYRALTRIMDKMIKTQ